MDQCNEKEPLIPHEEKKSQGETSLSHSQVVVPPKRKVTIEPVVLLVVYCYISLPALLQQYVYGRLIQERNITSVEDNQCDQDESNPVYQELQEIQATTSTFFTTIVVFTVVLSMITTPVIMLLSDRIGRKPLLIIVTSTMSVGFINWLVCVYFQVKLEFFYITAVILGLVGFGFSFLGLVQTYYCDVTSYKDRSFYMLLTEVLASVSSVLSNLTTGFLIKYIDVIYPFLAAVVSSVCSVFYTIFLLPESLTPEKKNTIAKEREAKLSLLGLYKKAFDVSFKDDGSGRRWRLLLASFILSTTAGMHGGLLVMMPVYLMNTPLCFDSIDIGLFIIEIYVLRFIGSLGIPWLLKSTSVSDTGYMMIGLIGDLFLFAIVGFLPYATWIFIGMSFFPPSLK